MELAVDAHRIVIPVIQLIIVSNVIWIIQFSWGNAFNVLIHAMNVQNWGNVQIAFPDITQIKVNASNAQQGTAGAVMDQVNVQNVTMGFLNLQMNVFHAQNIARIAKINISVQSVISGITFKSSVIQTSAARLARITALSALENKNALDVNMEIISSMEGVLVARKIVANVLISKHAQSAIQGIKLMRVCVFL